MSLNSMRTAAMRTFLFLFSFCLSLPFSHPHVAERISMLKNQVFTPWELWMVLTRYPTICFDTTFICLIIFNRLFLI